MRNKFQQVSKAGQAHPDQNDSSHECGDDKTVHAKFLYNGIYYYNKSSGGTANLDATSAENGNDQSGNNGGNQAFSGRNARSYRKGYGKRKGHYTNYYTSYQIFLELFLADPLFDKGKKLGCELR